MAKNACFREVVKVDTLGGNDSQGIVAISRWKDFHLDGEDLVCAQVFEI